MAYCGRCHKCGTRIRRVLDGEEWCPKCGQYQRPASHGWSSAYGECSPCWEKDNGDAIAEREKEANHAVAH